MTTEQQELIKAARANALPRVVRLLASGVNPNCGQGITPLLAAVRHGNVWMARALLNAGADPEARSAQGLSPMECAKSSDLPASTALQLVELLVKYGAKEGAECASACHSAHTRQHKERASAAWAGLMVGDALGAPAEFCFVRDIYRAYPDGLDRMVPGFGICTDRKAGVVTDDTQMAWCLHQSLLDADGWDKYAAHKRYMDWFETDPPDVGEAVSAALEGEPLSDSQGNGALMRVLPIALWAAEHPDFDWQTAAREDAAITHPHPVCGDANVVFVHALLQAMQAGATPRGVYESALQFAAEQGLHPLVLLTLRQAEAERPVYDGKYIGWVLVALQSAFYQLLHAADFRSALVDIVSSGGDTDTNAAIAGALLAALYGEDCIPHQWLVCVRAVNEARFTRLLPRRKERR